MSITAVSQGLAALTGDGLSLPSDLHVYQTLERKFTISNTNLPGRENLEVKSYTLHSAPQDNQGMPCKQLMADTA